MADLVRAVATQQLTTRDALGLLVQHKLWGDNTLGYHLVKHPPARGLGPAFVFILRRLGVPGAYLAAVIFALHPVHVESVAWISELKMCSQACYISGAA